MSVRWGQMKTSAKVSKEYLGQDVVQNYNNTKPPWRGCFGPTVSYIFSDCSCGSVGKVGWELVIEGLAVQIHCPHVEATDP